MDWGLFAVTWIKALHVIAVIAWIAGMMYLPRLFVYHAGAEKGSVQSETFKVMERRLMGMTRVGSAMTVIFGVATLIAFARAYPGFERQGWLIAKLVLVFALFGYQFVLARLVKAFARDEITKSSRWLRIFNEVPLLFLIAIVVLVVVKPF